MTRRVAIIGAGIAGLTAAYELSRTAELRREWEVEVFEMGERIGGRLASTHNPSKANRNEEHGLHVWFGWYDNTFRLAHEVWRDFRRPDGCPWQSIWDGMRPIHVSEHGLVDAQGSFSIAQIHHPPNPQRPGSDAQLGIPARLAMLLNLAAATVRTTRSAKSEQTPTIPIRPGRNTTIGRALQRLAALAQRAESSSGPARAAAVGLLHSTCKRIQRGATDPSRYSLEVAEWIRIADFALAVTSGLTSPEHGVWRDGDLDRICDWELRAWLRHHGARADTVSHCRLIEAIYDMPFAFEGGDRSRPVLEASTALRFTWRILGNYKGAVAYLLSAGAGETLVAPLYDLLRERGVRFRPFMELQRLVLNPERTTVEALSFWQRATAATGSYDPLTVRGGMAGFRHGVDWSQLREGDALRARGVDFYSSHADRGDAQHVTLTRGTDFDDVVLALPLGAIQPNGEGESPVRDWIAAVPRVRASLDRLHLVPTVAAQLWFEQPQSELGIRDRALVAWAKPFSVVCDMSPVIDHEDWGGRRPGSCVYLCGAWPVGGPAAEADQRARELIASQLDRHGASLGRQVPRLHRLSDGDPWEAQYVRANVEPWDLADLPLPGADRVRLEATGSGLSNLALAGSWVRTSVNTTSVEAAVFSGIAAARALGADVRTIYGEHYLRTANPSPRLPERDHARHSVTILSQPDYSPVLDDSPNVLRRRSS